jgi:uncharacterized protein (TIGR02099 family)
LNIRKDLHRFFRYVSTAVVVVLICYATLVVIGRELLPNLERYRTDINRALSNRLNIALTSEHISGSWIHLAPRIEIKGLCIGRAVDEVANDITDRDNMACLEQVSAEPDLLRSITNGGLVWRNLLLGNIHFTLEEGVDGRWSSPGVELFEQEPDSDGSQGLFKLVNRLLLNRLINVEKLSVTLRFHSGATETISFNDARLESEDGFHRFVASLSVDNKAPSAELIIEGQGSISEFDSFTATGYLHLNRINLSGSLNVLLGQWYPEMVERLGEIESELDADIWFTRDRTGRVNLSGRLAAEEIPLAWAADLPPVKNLSAQLTGDYRPGHNWKLRLQNLDFGWSGLDIKPLDLVFSQSADARWDQLSIAINHLNLASLGKILTAAPLMSSNAIQVLSTLDPQGHLNHLHMELDFDNAMPMLGLRTQIENLAMNSWAGKPAVRGLSGYFEWQDTRGFFDLESPDGFAMLYPGVYGDFMEYGNSSGRLNIEWQRVPGALTIAGGPIRIDGREGQIRAYLSLDLPFSNVRKPEMYLLAGIRNSDSRSSKQYIPQKLNPALLNWLDLAVGDMDIREGGFIWRGPLAGKSSAERSIQVYARVANGEVDYDPGWPKLTDLSAYITVDDARLYGVISSAQVGNAQLGSTVVKTVAGSRSSTGTLLSVEGDVSTPLEVGTSILLNSPLRERVLGLRNWEIGGLADVHLDLGIPLTGQKTGGYYRVEADINGGQLSHRALDIEFDSITGTIAHSDKKGLHSSGLHANFWGLEIDAKMVTEDDVTTLSSKGEVAVASLPQWYPLIAQQFSGKSDYRAELSLPVQGEPLLKFESTMNGIELNFPLPLSKAAEQIKPLAIEVKFAEATLIKAQLGEQLAAKFRITNFGLESGEIILGTNQVERPLDGSFHLTGETPVIDLDAWLEIFQHSSPGSGFDLATLEPQFNVRLSKLKYLDLTLDDILVTGKYDAEGLGVYLDNEDIEGQITLPPQADQPIIVDLNYLVLPRADSDSSESVLEQLEPAAFPYLSFATGGLRVGEQEFGDIGFLMRPQSDGLEITDIRGEIIGVNITDIPGGESATLQWQNINGVHTTRFAAMLKTYDLGAVLTAWALPKILESEEAVSIVDLSWPNKPWDIEVNNLTGQTVLNYEDGKFFQAPGNTTNAFIKIIGLLNFDTWLRRLSLDFSDFFSSGVSYDSLGGGLRFDEGTMIFDESIVVDLPSGKMRLTGNADLIAETIDANLVATLPVGTNLPWIVALVGGLPAAAGVYLTGKIFEKQVDRVSSLSYKITGPWSDPEVEVGRIFSDKTDG